MKSIVDLIGNTPIIKLKKASELTGCNIFGKAEFLNPGLSIKDRAALSIIKEALNNNKLEQGGTIVEGTAGNTGIGITMIANYYGIKTIIVINKNQSQEKKDALINLGAKLIEVDPVPYANPKNYVKYSKEVALDLAKKNKFKVCWANQFDNTINAQAHIETTAQEIYGQLNGKIDAFTCSSGTGGTIAGVSIGLKEKNKNIKIFLSDPDGSSLCNYIKNGKLESYGSSITEGIGASRISENFKMAKIDDAFQISDKESLKITFDLLKEEGLCLGSSSGVNVAGAIKLAKKIGKGKNIVTILCDVGTRYSSKLYNVKFLKSKGLPYPDWIE
ncbi:MAG: cysteine synthase A [Candidatus Pelagibacter sp.]|nr:cysteine synthase A [Candidatus Pelagibacter sp.]OUV97479.1 MAG: cysteine synthase A [Candidatus Pelagibacter sp. TMED142]|tara:strand:- start:130 stop:1122 length:993 start_codon:yes stop_codon:yes gene_type:complete